MAGGPGKGLEIISHHQPEEFRKGQKEMPPPRILTGIHLGWTRRAPELEWLAKDNPETNPVTINPRLWATWQSSPPGFPYPPALCLGTPFPMNSLTLSECVPPWTIHFWMLGKSPLSDSRKDPPSCNRCGGDKVFWPALTNMVTTDVTSEHLEWC